MDCPDGANHPETPGAFRSCYKCVPFLETAIDHVKIIAKNISELLNATETTAEGVLNGLY